MAKKKPTKTEELLRNSDKSLPLLDVQDLTVEFVTRRGIVRAVQHINISVAKVSRLRSSANPAPENQSLPTQ